MLIHTANWTCVARIEKCKNIMNRYVDPRGIVKSMLEVMRKTDNGETQVVKAIDEKVEDIYKILLGIEKFKKY